MEKIKDPVNLSLGDKISAYAGRLTRTTHKNSPWVIVDEPSEHFRSEITFDILNHLPGRRVIIAPDGIGTKVLIIDAVRGYKNAARDIIAMTAGDITRSGGCPIIFSNVLDVSSLGKNDTSETFKAVQLLFDGLVEVANELKFNCIKGETAELSVCVDSPNPDAVLKFNWSGFMLGVVHPDKAITGRTLAPGQVIISLREFGFRSNGISAVRATMENKFGSDWWQEEALLQIIATPSTLYDHLFTYLNGWHNQDNNFECLLKPHLICHLSGGSFKGKFFEDVLKPKGLAAHLYDLWEPPAVVSACAAWSGMDDEKLYEKWSCGQGALVVVDAKDVDPFLLYAKNFGIDAKVAGEIFSATNPELRIVSKFSNRTFRYN
jgi:phosphoribosylformylglycinamidine cyclo-ligase